MLRLKRLCLYVHSKLCLRLDDGEATASHLETLDITCRYLLHKEPIDALQVRRRAPAQDVGLSAHERKSWQAFG